MSITSNIKSALPKTDSAKEFMKFVEERSQTTDKSLVGTLMSTLTTMEFDGSRTMHEHVIEMTNIATRLKFIGMAVDENYNMLVQEETKLKNRGNHSIHYVNNQGAGKKVFKKHGKSKGPLKINESSTKL